MSIQKKWKKREKIEKQMREMYRLDEDKYV